MAAIKSLLNPMMDTGDQDNNSMDSKDDTSTVESDFGVISDALGDTRRKQTHKKQKMSKDAAIFKPGPIRGDCRYPPHEDHDEFTAAKHEALSVFPTVGLSTYARHIPYNSEKKLFLEKTGRECFEVFQYTFKIPTESATYTMIWDYNIGLVRTTPLFKCGQYSKTTPAKMLARNEGLKEICHSITGGALVAQGYWIPYEAAKAVAATFCWNIRYALTPVFGKDFPATCLHPDHEEYGSMQIDPEITKRCAEQARMYRELEQQHGVSTLTSTLNMTLNNSPTLMSVSTSTSRSPHITTTPKGKRQFKKIMPKPLEISSSGFASDVSSLNDCDGEASQDERGRHDDDDDKYVLSSPASQAGGSGGGFAQPWSAINSPNSMRSPSPKIKFRNPFAPPHSPASSTRSDSPNGGGSRRKRHRAARVIPRSYAPLDTLPPPYKPLFPGLVIASGAASGSKGKHGAQTETGEGDESEALPSPKAHARHAHYHHHHRRMDLDEDYDAGSDDSDVPMDSTGVGPPSAGSGVGIGNDKHGGSSTARKKSTKVFTDFNAALVLMQMRDVSTTMTTGLRRLKRPASL
ncbi:hypothetical protein LTR84_010372 [Exophiala bonariae]|uniref:HTH APSES-type domain-containing protein n=1 Tax=Exophiala bonariae TaxID=1690606 RepID=A0AAV9MWW1_9EURO|nr:hypothetical protein LTR84_010372 [Exophiala bonariae]